MLPSGAFAASKSYHLTGEFMLRMFRRVAGFSAFLLLCFASFAQSPGPPPAKSAVTSAESPEVRDFQKIEDAWADAINQRDQFGLELVLSPLFVDVSASGDINTRNQELAQLVAGEDKTMHLGQRVITVRMLGDIAVANGTYALHHKTGAGQVDEKGVFTHVFERTRGGWVCINSQRTVLREDANSKPKKNYGTELPFRIPLFTKDR